MLATAIVCYLLGTMALGAWSSRRVKTSGDFMLAGRQLPLFLSASALFATWFGSETIFGASSEYLKHGLLGVMEDPFGGALCLMLFGLFFVKPIYAMQARTLGDVYQKLFGKRVALYASIFMIPAYFGFIAAQLVAFGLILEAVSGLTMASGIVISAAVVLFYTFLGGMWAISITDFVQTIVIVVGLIWLAVTLSQEAGGISTILEQAPASSFNFFPPPAIGDWLEYLGAWAILGLGSIPSQDIYQRSMAAKSSNTAQKSLFLASGFYLTIGLLPLFIALSAKILYPDIYLENEQLLLPELVLQHSSVPLQIVFFGALLSAIMSTTSSSMLAPAALLTENIIKPIKKSVWKEQQLLWVLRTCLTAITIISVGLAFWKTNIYSLIGEASMLLLVSLLVPLTAGLYWKKASTTGANGSIFGGMVAYLLFYFEFVAMPFPHHLAALVVSMAAMIGGSLLFPRPKRNE
ncbi:sodium:solute symporter family protein [Cyclobacterium jeungdonense]|uniref:Sodium:solute symporter family protein n=1 Tax=Cyclobacterium jeungdonense TaxID=708087 RepID=A0ABT8CBY5_9BACT|nr:sodium:solute symporter family protein [Cyclobacterium jeungdonense]MDN3690325.1 sodium:solute symporter family protein [Cyclobacterium jeungdonense]